MRRVILVVIAFLFLTGAASALDPWTYSAGCWTYNTTGTYYVMWNATGTTTWTVPSMVSSANYLVVAGGGGGGTGNYGGGGGGAGGLLNGTTSVVPGEVLTIIVGTGGAAGATQTTNFDGNRGTNGTISSFGNLTINITATGGGGGGRGNQLETTTGRAGGSGGGSSGVYPTLPGGATVLPFQGHAGASGSGFGTGGGGGGANETGNQTVYVPARSGGNGAQFNTSGILTWYAGGGAGGNAAGGTGLLTGGLGGGGDGGNSSAVNAGNGAATTGGGGGGNAATTSAAGNGGSGIVIINYTISSAPVSTFTVNATSGSNPCVVNFTDTSSPAGTSWSWNYTPYTNGVLSGVSTQFSTLQNPIYTFGTPGVNNEFLITLNSTSVGGSSVSTQITWINTSGVTASFSANTTGSMAYPRPVQFTDTSTGGPVSWNWSFGDGAFSILQHPVHTYSPVVNDTAVESAYDIYGSWTNASAIINTTAIGSPYAYFSETPTAGTPGLFVAFTDMSSVGSTTTLSYNWSFGDSAGTNPMSSVVGSTNHVYSYAGIFTPQLTIINANGTSTYTGPAITISIAQNVANTNVVYSAQLYRFILQNLQGGLLSNISVVMTPMNYTMSANWTSQLFGISSQVNLTSGILSGKTGSDGSIGVPMITSLEYQINISGLAGDGETVPIFSINEYPPSVGTDIILSVPTIQHPAISLTPVPTTISYNLYNQTISSNQTVLSTNYLDSTGGTNYTIVTVVNQSGYVLNTTIYTGTAANNIVNNFTYNFTSGDTVAYGFAAYSTTERAWNNITQPLSFNTGTSLLGGAIPTAYDGWIAIILIVFVSAAFTASSVYLGVIGVGMMGEFFYHVTQWFTPAISGTAFDAMCVFWIAIGIIGFITKKSRTVF